MCLSLAESTQAEAYIDTTTDIDFLILLDILTFAQSSFHYAERGLFVQSHKHLKLSCMFKDTNHFDIWSP